MPTVYHRLEECHLLERPHCCFQNKATTAADEHRKEDGRPPLSEHSRSGSVACCSHGEKWLEEESVWLGAWSPYRRNDEEQNDGDVEPGFR